MENKKSPEGQNQSCFRKYIELKDDTGKLKELCDRKSLTNDDLSTILSSTTLKPNFNDMETVAELGVEPYVTNGSEESIAKYYEIDLSLLPTFEASLHRPQGKGFILYTKEDIKGLVESEVDAIELLLTSESNLMIISHYLYSPE